MRIYNFGGIRMNLSAKKVGLVLLIVIVVGGVSLGILGIIATGNLLTDKSTSQGDIAVINISGPIVGGGAGSSPWQPNYASAREIMNYINQARENQAVKAILLRVNSPGGSSAASDAIYQELKKFKQTGRPIVASMGSTAASGGYYVSCLADEIYANPATLTGSIGVIMQFQNLKGLYDKLGINHITLKSGKYKDIGSATRKMTEQEKQIMQEMVNEVYDRFVEVITEGRNLKESKVRELADGRIYNGEQAKKLNLIDQLGTYYDAVEAAAELAGIKGEPKLIKYGQPSPLERLIGAVNNLTIKLLGVSRGNSLPMPANKLEEPKSDFLYYQLLRDGKYRKLKLQY